MSILIVLAIRYVYNTLWKYSILIPISQVESNPIAFDKSFPVPNGIAPNIHFSKFIFSLNKSSIVDKTLPSPPPISILISLLGKSLLYFFMKYLPLL